MAPATGWETQSGSLLVDGARAPKQGFEARRTPRSTFDDDVADDLRELATGEEILVLTWLHLADRSGPRASILSTTRLAVCSPLPAREGQGRNGGSDI